MRKRILASAIALCMVLSLSVPALATEDEVVTLPEEEITVQTETEPIGQDSAEDEIVEEEILATEDVEPVEDASIEEPGQPETLTLEDSVPEITDITISGASRVVVNDSYIFTAALDSTVTSYTATVTLSDGAVFTSTTPDDGDLYVESAADGTATLKFNLTVGDVNISTDQFALILEETGNNVWTGGFENATGLTLETLAGYLVDQDIQLAAGALGSGSEARDILVNMDDENMVLILCAPDATVYTVDYVVDEDTTITWKLPAGAEIPAIAVELSGSQEIEGWYTDADCTNALVSGTTVTGNTTLYAKVTGGTAASGDFYNDLINGRTATIEDLTDWNTFVEHADEVEAGQLIRLGADIDCNGAIYDSMTFAGNFDGGGYTISNATFRAVDSAYYNSSESDIVCSGMFAALGAGQIIANLTLDNITAQYASTYSAPLAGLADGTSANPVLIQNVHVRNSSASGRTAAGVVGFTRNTTVRYCSSRDTTISGLANGGGIVGINNAVVEYCYSTTSPTALPSLFGGNTGGVVSKNVRGGYTEYCWATMTVVGDSSDGGTDVSPLVVSLSMTYLEFVAQGFSQSCWTMGTGIPADFNRSVVAYSFS